MFPPAPPPQWRPCVFKRHVTCFVSIWLIETNRLASIKELGVDRVWKKYKNHDFIEEQNIGFINSNYID